MNKSTKNFRNNKNTKLYNVSTLQFRHYNGKTNVAVNFVHCVLVGRAHNFV